MSNDAPPNHHPAPEDISGFIEATLSRRRRREVEEHLDTCPDCVEFLGAVFRSSRPLSPEREALLTETPGPCPEELLQKLRPSIIGSSPGSARRGTRPSWGTLLAVTAAAAGLILVFLLVRSTIVRPARSRQLADTAIHDLVQLRQATGRVTLRYIPEFQRAVVTRSPFEADDPAEAHIETRLRQAVGIAPALARAHIALGLFLLDKGSLDESENELSQALGIEPSSTLAKNGLAVIRYLQALARPELASALQQEGLRLLREAQREDPQDPQVAFNLAVFYQESGSPERARNSWRAYLALDSDSEWAQIALENLEILDAR